MRSYRIPLLGGPEIDWASVEPARVDRYPWGGAYRPETALRAAVLDGKGIAFRGECREENPLALRHNFYDEVFRDSCIEVFFGTESGGPYLNCEMNANGAARIGFGRGKEGRVPVSEFITPPNVGAVRGDGRWSVEVFFSLAALEAVFGHAVVLTRGARLWGNFFKCGRDCDPPHFGTWNPVTSDVPSFHRPDCFGEWIVG